MNKIFCKIRKNGLIYAFIGLFVVGGVGVALAFIPNFTDTGQLSLDTGSYPYYNIFQAAHSSNVSFNDLTENTSGFVHPYLTVAAVSSGNFTWVNGDDYAVCGGTSGSYWLIDNTHCDWFYYNSSVNDLVAPPDHSTHIISFTPPDGFVATSSTQLTSVDFDIHAYVAPSDIGNFLTVKINYRNIDQNLLLNAPCTTIDFAGTTCSNYSFTLFAGTATSSGDFYFATSSLLARGNYRVEASIDTATQLGGLNLGFFTFLGAKDNTQDHQFIVASSTLIGNISQSLYTDLNGYFGTLPATSTAALAGSCAPFTAGFDIRLCTAFLFIPDAGQLSDAMNNLRTGILQKMPFGYVTRMIDLIATTSTSTLPVLSYTFQSDSPLAGDNLSFDTGAYMAQASQLSNQMTSNTDHKTVWQIFETPVKLFIYLVLVFAMMRDVTGLPLINHRR